MAFQPSVLRLAGAASASVPVTGTLVETQTSSRTFQPGEFNSGEVWRLWFAFRSTVAGTPLLGNCTCNLRVGTIAGTILAQLAIDIGLNITRGYSAFSFTSTAIVRPMGADPALMGEGNYVAGDFASIAQSRTAPLVLVFTVQLGNINDSVSLAWFDLVKSP